MKWSQIVLLFVVMPCFGFLSFGGVTCGGGSGGWTAAMRDPYQGNWDQDPIGGGCQPTFCPFTPGVKHGVSAGGGASAPTDPNHATYCHPEGWELQFRRHETLPKDPAHIVYRLKVGEKDSDPRGAALLKDGCDHPDYYRWSNTNYVDVVPFWKPHAEVPALSDPLALVLIVVILGLGVVAIAMGRF